MGEKTPWHFLSGGLGVLAGLFGGLFGGNWLADLWLPPNPLVFTAGIFLAAVCGTWLGGRLGVAFVDLLIFLSEVRDDRRCSRERQSSVDTIRHSLRLNG